MSAPSAVCNRGSCMEPGDTARFWKYYRDQFLRVRLGAEVASNRILTQNRLLREFVDDPASLDRATAYSFFPPAMSAQPHTLRAEATMTGGRTFLIDESAAERLGMPSRIRLDLKKLGWGEGWLEMRLEVKGAGTLFHRTRLSPTRLEAELEKHPTLLANYREACGTCATPRLATSSAAFMFRQIGGQSSVLAQHGVQ